CATPRIAIYSSRSPRSRATLAAPKRLAATPALWSTRTRRTRKPARCSPSSKREGGPRRWRPATPSTRHRVELLEVRVVVGAELVQHTAHRGGLLSDVAGGEDALRLLARGVHGLHQVLIGVQGRLAIRSLLELAVQALRLAL